jgi:hypothetical protein
MAFEKDKVKTDIVCRGHWPCFKRNVDRYVVVASEDDFLVVAATCWDWDLFTNLLICLDLPFS